MEEMKNENIQTPQMTEEEKAAFKALLGKFIASHGEKSSDQSEAEWLASQMKEEQPELTDEQAAEMATEAVAGITEFDANMESVNEAAAQGICKEKWFADNVAKASAGVSVIALGEYLSKLDRIIELENCKRLANVVLNDIPYEHVDYNSFSAKALATEVGRKAGSYGLIAAAVAGSAYVIEQVASGEEIDWGKGVGVALKTGADSFVKTSLAGALKIGMERGVINFIPKGTPIWVIANIACIAIENVKILAKVAVGEITMAQAIDQMGRTTVASTIGIFFGTKGALIGAAALSWIPVIGPAAGMVLGSTIGYMVGENLGNKICDGLKKVEKKIKTLFKGKPKNPSKNVTRVKVPNIGW